MTEPDAQSVEAGIAELLTLGIAELRVRWRAIFKSEPPEAFGPDLFRRSIAQRLQEDAYGGLDRATARLLIQLIAQAGKNSGKIVVPRRIKTGAILVREWKGTSHRVTVADEGFVYQGRPYTNLSEIARLIAGSAGTARDSSVSVPVRRRHDVGQVSKATALRHLHPQVYGARAGT